MAAELDDAVLQYLVARPAFADLLYKPSVRKELWRRLHKLHGSRAESLIVSLDRFVPYTAAGMIFPYLEEYVRASKACGGRAIEWSFATKSFPLARILKALCIINQLLVTSSDEVFTEIRTLSVLFYVLYSSKGLKEALNLAVRHFFGDSLASILLDKGRLYGAHQGRKRAVLLLDGLVNRCHNKKSSFMKAIEKFETEIPITLIAQNLKSFYESREPPVLLGSLKRTSRTKEADLRDSKEKFRGRMFSPDEIRELELCSEDPLRKRARSRKFKRRKIHENHDVHRTRYASDSESDDDDVWTPLSIPRKTCSYTTGTNSHTRRGHNGTRRGGSEVDFEENSNHGAEIRLFDRKNADRETVVISSTARRQLEGLQNARTDLRDAVGEDVLDKVLKQAEKAGRPRRKYPELQEDARSASPFTEDDSTPPPSLPEVEHKVFPESIREPQVYAKGYRFTHAECERLIQGLKKFGWGKWRLILQTGDFHPGCTNVRLKDKARSMRLKPENFPLPRGVSAGSGRPNPRLRTREDKAEEPENESSIECSDADSK